MTSRYVVVEDSRSYGPHVAASLIKNLYDRDKRTTILFSKAAETQCRYSYIYRMIYQRPATFGDQYALSELTVIITHWRPFASDFKARNVQRGLQRRRRRCRRPWAHSEVEAISADEDNEISLHNNDVFAAQSQPLCSPCRKSTVVLKTSVVWPTLSMLFNS